MKSKGKIEGVSKVVGGKWKRWKGVYPSHSNRPPSFGSFQWPPSLEPSIGHQALDPSVGHQALDPSIGHQALDPSIGHQALDPPSPPFSFSLKGGLGSWGALSWPRG